MMRALSGWIAGCTLALLAGCGSGSTPTTNQCKTAPPSTVVHPQPMPNYPGLTISGTVSVGSLPVIGASVQLYAAGTAGNESMPTALGAASITDTNGAFALSMAYTCPFNSSMLYLVSRSGKSGSSGATNAGIVLATALGACNSLVQGKSYTLDEATTVATAYAFAQFLSAGGNIGASATNFEGLILAAATAANLADVTAGTAPGANFPANGTAPVERINTVANALNACAMSSGASSTQCAGLYAAVSPYGSPVASNTLDAAMLLAQNPTGGSAVYGLSEASAAYLPALADAPSDWTMFVSYTGGGMDKPTALGLDSNGNIWVANYYYVASYFSNNGAPIFSNGVTGNNLSDSYGMAVDQNDVAWIANEEGGSINGGNGSLTLLNSAGMAVAGSAGYSAGGIDFPDAVAIDRGGTTWIADYGGSHVTLLDSAGVPLSGTTGYTTSLFAFPEAIAVDNNCYGYVANYGSNMITKVAPDGSSFTNYVVGNGPSGVAIDAANNVWVANYIENSIGLVSNDGTVISGAGYTGGGLDDPQGIAVDGRGTVWVANVRGHALSEFSGASTAFPGASLSPAAGIGLDAALVEAFALAIDSSGNLWVTNSGNATLTEFIGLAGPVKTPLLGAVSQP